MTDPYRIRIWIRVATLVRRALTEVCTVPVLLVNNKLIGCSLCNDVSSFAREVSKRNVIIPRADLPVMATKILLLRTVACSSAFYRGIPLQSALQITYNGNSVSLLLYRYICRSVTAFMSTTDWHPE